MSVYTVVVLIDSIRMFVFFFKQKTAYEMLISVWSSDVCSSDLLSIIHGAPSNSRVRQFDEDVTMQLQKGEKRSLSDLGIGGRCEVAVSFGLSGVDIAAFGLDASKKIGDDRYVKIGRAHV